ncbi:MAG: GNAT family N-acetyltransferase [Culicoidibacterales bacterium]
MIRQAQITDLEQVCALVFRASQFVFAHALHQDEQQAHEELFAKMYLNECTKFSLKNTLVYEIDGQVVGCIVSYAAADELAFIEEMAKITGNGYRFPQEAIVNTAYIDSLAVAPSHEGQGIAKKLILAAGEQTQLPLSLLVEKQKAAVKAYYERLGFEAQAIEIYFETEMYPMLQAK